MDIITLEEQEKSLFSPEEVKLLRGNFSITMRQHLCNLKQVYPEKFKEDSHAA